MSTTITEHRPVTFADFPLAAHAQWATEGVAPAKERLVAVSACATVQLTALERLFDTRQRISVVLYREAPVGGGPICVGRSDQLVAEMSELADLCEADVEASKIWVALRRCRDFVQWRAEAESRVAGGVAA